MRIESLDDYRPAETDFAVLLGSSEQLVPLPDFYGAVVFCFSEDELMAMDHKRAVLVDVPSDLAVRILTNLVRDRGEAEYWAPRSATVNLCSLVGSEDPGNDTPVISGLHVSGLWIHLRVNRATRKTREPGDFLLGLSAPVTAAAATPRDNDTHSDTTTLKALFISRAAALAKPVKKYLPSSVVVLLYKILEKIR